MLEPDRFGSPEPMRRESDGTVYGYRCGCGGFWKVYQSPQHAPDCGQPVRFHRETGRYCTCGAMARAWPRRPDGSEHSETCEVRTPHVA